MELYVYTKAPDLSQAVATTLTDLALLVAALADPTDADNAATLGRIADSIPQLTLGDTETIDLLFYSDGTTVDAVSSDATQTASVALGYKTGDSTEDLAETSSFTLASNTRTGHLDLTGTALADTVSRALMRYGCGPRRPSLPMTLQVALTDSSDRRTTYALVPVVLNASVL